MSGTDWPITRLVEAAEHIVERPVLEHDHDDVIEGPVPAQVRHVPPPQSDAATAHGVVPSTIFDYLSPSRITSIG
jgi:hypothetical protein